MKTSPDHAVPQSTSGPRGLRRGVGAGVAFVMVVATVVAGLSMVGAGSSGAATESSAQAHGAHGLGTRADDGRGHDGSLAPAAHLNPASAGAASSPRIVAASAWSEVPSPNVSTQNVLYRTSCVSASFCVAVGQNQAPQHGRTLVEQWNGSTWSIVPSPNSSATDSSGLFGVSCVTTSFCEAVGYTFVGGNFDQTLVEQWNGTVWSIVSSPNVSATNDNDLYNVSCASASFCIAAGESYGAVDRTLGLKWNGSNWSMATTANASPTMDDYLNTVSCKSASFCVAAGATADTGFGDRTLIEQWNGSSWSVVASPNPSLDAAYIDGVSCPSVTFCVAAGFTLTAGPNTSLIEQWNGSTWSIVPSPVTAGTLGDELNEVSCLGPTSCEAVGKSFTSGNPNDNHVTLGMVWDGSTWALQPPVNPAVTTSGNDFATLYGLSCVAGPYCIATGYSYPGSGADEQTLAESIGVPAPTPGAGYRLVAGDGGVFSFGGASFNGSPANLQLNKPIVGMASTPDGGGYWLVAADGGVFGYGNAHFHGSAGSLSLNKPIVGMAGSPGGQGYWLAASDGGVFTYGDAGFFGSAGSLSLNKPVVGITGP